MIVKDEEAVIERCLRSVRPVIDAWCIVDTGSVDRTKELVRSALADLPGELFEAPWTSFAHNRTDALDLARRFGDYSLMIDADEVCVVDSESLAGFKPTISADFYDVVLHYGGIEYVRAALTSTARPFRYRAVLHEFLEPPPGARHGGLVCGFHYEPRPDGARSHNPNKYFDDAALLEQALASGTEPDLESRYRFYLAQSYRDAGDLIRAAENYELRSHMVGWVEETYIANLWCGRLWSRLGRDFASVVECYLRAGDLCPHRAEAYCEAAALARSLGRMPTAYVFAARAAQISQPAAGLFLEPDVYRWRAFYELSVSAWYAGRFEEGRDAAHRVLNSPAAPDAERRAVAENMRFYGPA